MCILIICCIKSIPTINYSLFNFPLERAHKWKRKLMKNEFLTILLLSREWAHNWHASINLSLFNPFSSLRRNVRWMKILLISRPYRAHQLSSLLRLNETFSKSQRYIASWQRLHITTHKRSHLSTHLMMMRRWA